MTGIPTTVANERPAEKAPYRPDLDGLRALAIVAVVLFHADAPGAGGGFTGVDIFFVLSGFLITRLLLAELHQEGRVDFLNFWARRLRRLLPTASGVIFATSLIGHVVLPGYLRPGLAADVTSAALNFANFRFAKQAIDYFAHEDQPSLLLHFWSLSVEEQFYAIWPVILLAFARIVRRSIKSWLPPLLLLVSLASFIYSLWLQADNQPLAFFHTLSRCWQLSLGALLAVCSLRGWTLPDKLQEPAIWFGMACAATSIMLYNAELPYPGFYALLPALGSAAVILGGESSTNPPRSARRFMSAPVLVWIGRRSYAWYLWHWPVMRLSEIMFPSMATAPLISVPISLVLAAATHALIENPVRYGWLSRQPPSYTFIAACAGVAGLLISANLILGRPQALAGPEMAKRIASARSDRGPNYADGCHLDYDVTVQPPCAYGAAPAARRAVLFGDSHAAQWLAPLASASADAGWTVQSWTKSSCPAIDVTIWYRPREARFTACEEWRENVLSVLTGSQKPDVVFIASRIDYDGWIMDRDTDRILQGQLADTAWREGLRRVLSRLVAAGVHVVLIRDTPTISRELYECLEGGGGVACAEPLATAFPSHSDLDVAGQFGDRVQILDLTKALCGALACPILKRNMIVYLDEHHLTATFASTLAPHFQKTLLEYDRIERR